MDDTETRTHPATAADAGGHPPTADPRPVLDEALATGLRTVAALRPEQMELPTPCGEFDVRHMVAHVVAVLDRVTAIGAEGNPFSTPNEVEIGPDEAWPGRWEAAAERLRAAWADDELLDRTVALPWTQVPGREALAIYVNEITVHTWDLARATGQEPQWADDALALSDQAIHDQLPLAERAPIWAEVFASLPAGVPFEPPFADAVPVPDHASPVERLVAWNGRRP